MIQVATKVIRKGRASAKNPKLGGISPIGAPLGGRRCILSAIMPTPRNNRLTIKMNMRRLQPARRPSVPIKILRRTDACGGTDGGGEDSGGPLPGSGAARSIESFKGSLLGYSSIYVDGYSEVPQL